MDELIEELRLSFEQKANSEEAAKQKAYLKNRFKHFGLKTPIRREITKPVEIGLKQHSIDEVLNVIELCFVESEREFHHVGVDIMCRYSKKLPKDSFAFIRKLIETHSWWDTVDMLAVKVLGQYLINFPKERNKMDEWINDENMWIRRSAILFQLKYKDQTDENLLFRYCELRAHETEFFIRKVIGLVLREYSRTNKQAVEDFVMKNESILSQLSKKEALRLLNR